MPTMPSDPHLVAPSTCPPERAAAAAPPPALRRWWRQIREYLPDVLAFTGALLVAALAAVLLVVLGGCGGGVGTEGTGSYTISSSGTISGYGSIVVNDVHFDESTAAIVADDDSATTADVLALGMTVEVQAGAISTDSAGRQRSTARQVRVVRAILGPVTAVDTAAGTATVLDQTVQVRADTVFGDGLADGLSALGVGQVVEVYGDWDATAQRWRATRIASVTTPVTQYSLRGVVTAVAGATVEVCGRRYDASALSSSGVQAGSEVRLVLAAATAEGAWKATDGQARERDDDDGRQAQLEGVIGQLLSARLLLLDGVVVDIGAAVVSGTPAAGAPARAIGYWRNGQLVATQLVVRATTQVQTFVFEGQLRAVDTTARTVTLRSGSAGQDLTISLAGSSLEWKNGLSLQALAALVGRRFEVKAVLASNGVLQATQIKLER
jgi:hypothetical protein